MIKGFTSQRKNVLTILSIVFALSFCLLSSYNASAVGSWSSSDSSYTSLTYDVYGGCLYDGYELDNSAVHGAVRLGTNAVTSTTSSSSLYNCGYRYYSSHMNYLEHSAAYRRTYTDDNGTITDTFSSLGGTNNMISGNNNNNFADYDFDIYNQVESISFKFASGTTTPFTLPIEPDKPEGSDPWYSGYAFYIFSFDVPNSALATGLQFGIASVNSLTVSSSSNRTFSDVRSEMNDYILTWCGDLTAYSRGFPDELMDLQLTTTSGYSKCYVGGTVPLTQVANGVKFYNGNKLVLEAKDSSEYSKSYWTTTSGKVLPRYGYPWHGIFTTPSYKTMGSKSADPLNFVNPRFDIVWCTTGQECDDMYSKAQALMTDTFASIGSVNNSGDYSNTVQEEIDYNERQANNANTSMSGLNVGFSVPWIFSGWFNLFIDNDCVDIPNIQSLIHSSEGRVCSPWKDTSVRTILTPIITVMSSMLLFGFVVRWLKHGSTREFDNG